MADENPNSVLSADELEAAITQAESIALGEGGIPSLADGTEQSVIPIPVPGPNVGRPRDPGGHPADPGDALAAQPGQPNAAAPPPVAGGAPASGAEQADAVVDAGENGHAPLAYRVLDTALAVLNRPFAALNPAVRDVVGLAGIVTIIMSLLAGLLLPSLLRPTDPLSFVHEKQKQRVAAPAGGQTAAKPAPHR